MEILKPMTHRERFALVIYRARNLLVDAYAWAVTPFVKKAEFHDGLTKRGLLKVAHAYGPVYPPILADVEALCRMHRDDLTDDALDACAGGIEGYRGFVTLRGQRGRVLEFFFGRGEVYVEFVGASSRHVVVKTTLQAAFYDDAYDVLRQLLNNLEDRLYNSHQAAAE